MTDLGMPRLSDMNRPALDTRIASGKVPKLVEENRRLKKALKAIVHARAGDLTDLIKRARQLLKELGE